VTLSAGLIQFGVRSEHEGQPLSEEQIIGILKEQEAGVSVADLCHKHGVSDASTAQLGKANCQRKVRTG
jgi:hypothetical protein